MLVVGRQCNLTKPSVSQLWSMETLGLKEAKLLLSTWKGLLFSFDHCLFYDPGHFNNLVFVFHYSEGRHAVWDCLLNLNVLHDDSARAHRLGALLMDNLLHVEVFLYFSHLRYALHYPHLGLAVFDLHH